MSLLKSESIFQTIDFIKKKNFTDFKIIQENLVKIIKNKETMLSCISDEKNLLQQLTFLQKHFLNEVQKTKSLSSWLWTKALSESIGDLISKDEDIRQLSLQNDKSDILESIVQVGCVEAQDILANIQKTQPHRIWYFGAFTDALIERMFSCFHVKAKVENNNKHRLLAALIGYMSGIDFIRNHPDNANTNDVESIKKKKYYFSIRDPSIWQWMYGLA